MKPRRVAATAAGIAAVALAVAWWTAPRDDPERVVTPTAPDAQMRTAAPRPAVSEDASRDAKPAPGAPAGASPVLDVETVRAATSLRGTQRDGAYTLGPDGRLLLDADLVRVFDYWLALSGEVPESRIRALLFADARAAHGEAVAAQAAAAFERYLGLRAQLASTVLADDLATRFAQIRAARRAWFGADAEAMFGEEEAQVAYTLTRERLASSDLPPAQRAARLAALDAARAPSLQAAQREATAAVMADAQTRALEALDATPAERRAEREAQWGAEAAARLARLDAERAAWDRRVADYLRDRATLDEPAAAALRAARFTPAERARIEALEAIGQLHPPNG